MVQSGDFYRARCARRTLEVSATPRDTRKLPRRDSEGSGLIEERPVSLLHASEALYYKQLWDP